MCKAFRPWNPEQTFADASLTSDWLPEIHLVFFLLDLSAELNLGEIHAYYRQSDPPVEKAYDPSDDGGAAPVPLLRRFAQFPQDRGGLLEGRCLPGADRQPATEPQPDQSLPLSTPVRSGLVIRGDNMSVYFLAIQSLPLSDYYEGSF
jgi:hypothetical protein